MTFDYELCKRQGGKAIWGDRYNQHRHRHVQVMGENYRPSPGIYPVRDDNGDYFCAGGDLLFNLDNLPEPKPERHVTAEHWPVELGILMGRAGDHLSQHNDSLKCSQAIADMLVGYVPLPAALEALRIPNDDEVLGKAFRAGYQLLDGYNSWRRGTAYQFKECDSLELALADIVAHYRANYKGS